MSADQEQNAIDSNTTAGKLAKLEQYRASVASRQETSLEKQHAKGKLSALERIEHLLDEGSFQELDGFTRHPLMTPLALMASLALLGLSDT